MRAQGRGSIAGYRDWFPDGLARTGEITRISVISLAETATEEVATARPRLADRQWYNEKFVKRDFRLRYKAPARAEAIEYDPRREIAVRWTTESRLAYQKTYRASR